MAFVGTITLAGAIIFGDLGLGGVMLGAGLAGLGAMAASMDDRPETP
jgi:hypothetical protein